MNTLFYSTLPSCSLCCSAALQLLCPDACYSAERLNSDPGSDSWDPAQIRRVQPEQDVYTSYSHVSHRVSSKETHRSLHNLSIKVHLIKRQVLNQTPAGRTSLTGFQLEVVRGKGLPRHSQGRHRLEMRDVLLYVCRSVADAVRKKPFDYSSWHKNQSAPCNVVTDCYVIRLLQDFNLKHTGKHFVAAVCGSTTI